MTPRCVSRRRRRNFWTKSDSALERTGPFYFFGKKLSTWMGFPKLAFFKEKWQMLRRIAKLKNPDHLLKWGWALFQAMLKSAQKKISRKKNDSTYKYLNAKAFHSFNRQAHIFQAKGPQAGKRVNMFCFEWSEKWKWLCRVVCEEVLTGRAASPTRGRRKLCSYFSCVVVFGRTGPG